MSADRELMELADKAAGLNGHVWREDAECMQRLDMGTYHLSWNPLEWDGDALRLAVELRIDIGFYGENGMYAQAKTKVPECQGSGGEFDAGEDDGAVTRRAIVCAAAEIGKAMP